MKVDSLAAPSFTQRWPHREPSRPKLSETYSLWPTEIKINANTFPTCMDDFFFHDPLSHRGRSGGCGPVTILVMLDEAIRRNMRPRPPPPHQPHRTPSAQPLSLPFPRHKPYRIGIEGKDWRYRCPFLSARARLQLKACRTN